MIGVDPQRVARSRSGRPSRTHTRDSGYARTVARPSGCWPGLGYSKRAHGDRGRRGSGICSHSSWSALARSWLTSPPRGRLGCGCWVRRKRARMIQATRTRPRSPGCATPHLRLVERENHRAVGRLLVDRHHDLTALRTQAVCRLHAVLCALVPGGLGRRLSAVRAR